MRGRPRLIVESCNVLVLLEELRRRRPWTSGMIGCSMSVLSKIQCRTVHTAERVDAQTGFDPLGTRNL